MLFLFLDGDVLFVTKRLDARYDWLPSPYTLKAKHPKTKLVHYGDGCSCEEEVSAASAIIVVSRKGKCSFFDKVILHYVLHIIKYQFVGVFIFGF